MANGRWHTAHADVRVLYASTHPSTALLEMMVQVYGDPRRAPYDLVLLELGVTVAARRGARHIAETELSSAWTEDIASTRQLGDAWLADAQAPLLVVPCALSPVAENVLVNVAAIGDDVALEQVIDLRPKLSRVLAAIRRAPV